MIIITGAPCTGKTTIGRRIAEEFPYPFITRDGIKETLFDSLAWKDRDWSKKLGAASYDLLFYLIEVQLKASQSFIVESNFQPEFNTQTFLDLKQKYPFEPFQILCKTDSEILFQRFKDRAMSGERHPGHVDHLNYEEFAPERLKGKHGILEIGGRVVEIDTTDFGKIDHEHLFQEIRSANLQSK